MRRDAFQAMTGQHRQRRKSSEGGEQGRRCRTVGDDLYRDKYAGQGFTIAHESPSACSKFLSGAILDRLPESECASRARAADRTPGLVATQRSSIAVGRRW